jgi:hypothetical protein
MGEVTSMTKTQHKYSRDPLYDWLVYKIHSVFEFLHTEWGFEQQPVKANGRGCSQVYTAEGTRIQVWAEMAGRPECDIVRNGVRRSLNDIIAKNCPDLMLPERPEYQSIEGEKKDFVGVLKRYAEALHRQREVVCEV